MPKNVEITIPSDRTEGLLRSVQDLDGVLGVRLDRAVSIRPPGDVLTVNITNGALPELMKLVVDHNIGSDDSTSFATSEPLSYTAAPVRELIVKDTVESTWEEMEMLLHNESSINVNMLALMAVAGVLATLGLAIGAIHLVIAAMVVAPGFEPISRMSLGFVARGTQWRPGLRSTLGGYAALVVAATATGFAIQGADWIPLEVGMSYQSGSALLTHWTTFSLSSLLVSATAAIAGGIVITINRPLLTMGALIGLALVPSAASIGYGISIGEFELAGRGLLRWMADVGFVAGFSALVFLWKRIRVQKRPTRL